METRQTLRVVTGHHASVFADSRSSLCFAEGVTKSVWLCGSLVVGCHFLVCARTVVHDHCW